MRAFARIHSGLRASMARPSRTPASASRPSRRTDVPPERVKRDRSSGDSRHATSSRSASPAGPPHRSAARPTTASTTSRMVTDTPSAASEVTGLPAMPHGTMWPNIARSGATFRAKPCMVRPRDSRTPMAQILRASTHTPG